MSEAYGSVSEADGSVPQADGPVSEAKAVLVFSNYETSNIPHVISFGGLVDADMDFEFGENTQSFRACGATLNGEFWVFGGQDYKRQVKSIRIESEQTARGSIEHIQIDF